MAGNFNGNFMKWDFPATTNNPHIARYMLAKGFIFPWETVLDAACGGGYGSKFISLSAKKVYGYEVDEGQIVEANHDKPKNCEFKVMDLDTCELPDVDVAVTIETVEHLNDMHHFIKQLKKHVKRCIIITVPLGGTSESYKDWPPGPETEKNDFGSEQDVDKLFEDKQWHKFLSIKFGYSHFGVYCKGQPKLPTKI